MIDAHVIPDNVLFLGPTAEGEKFNTLAFTDMLKVFASITSLRQGDENISCKIKFYVL